MFLYFSEPSVIFASCSGTYTCCDDIDVQKQCADGTDCDEDRDCTDGSSCIDRGKRTCNGASTRSCSGSTQTACEHPGCPNAGQQLYSNGCSWSCTPNCTGKSCGDDDGCGGKCDVDSSCGALGTCDDTSYTCVCRSDSNLCSWNEPTGVCPGGATGWVCETHYGPANDSYPNCCNYTNQCADGSSECCSDPQLATPQNLTTTGVQDSTHIKLTWSTVTTDVNGTAVATDDVFGYRIQVSQDGSNWSESTNCNYVSGQSSSECTDTVQSGIQLYYRIQADGDCPGDRGLRL